MEIIVLAVLVGLSIGVVVGALGAGGGILAVPVLVYVLGQDPHEATASSLVIVGLTALASLTHHARVGTVAWRDGLLFGLGSVLAALIGARASALVPSHLLMILFAVLLLGVSAVMLRSAIRGRAAERADERAGTRTQDDGGDGARFGNARDGLDADPRDGAVDADAVEIRGSGSPAEPATLRPSTARLLLAATATGLLTGFFGVGGGFIVVPMLVLVLGLSMRRAAGTSLLVMIIATAASLAGRAGTGVHVDWPVTLLFAAGSMAGGALGGPLSARVRPSTLVLAFAVLLGVVGLFTGVREVVG